MHAGAEDSAVRATDEAVEGGAEVGAEGVWTGGSEGGNGSWTVEGDGGQIEGGNGEDAKGVGVGEGRMCIIAAGGSEE